VNVQKFKETICRIVGHSYPRAIIICERCGYNRLEELLNSEDGLSKIARAMVAPIKTQCDYRGIGRRFCSEDPNVKKDKDASEGKEGKDS
jgi:hypothetical protein